MPRLNTPEGMPRPPDRPSRWSYIETRPAFHGRGRGTRVEKYIELQHPVMLGVAKHLLVF